MNSHIRLRSSNRTLLGFLTIHLIVMTSGCAKELPSASTLTELSASADSVHIDDAYGQRVVLSRPQSLEILEEFAIERLQPIANDRRRELLGYAHMFDGTTEVANVMLFSGSIISFRGAYFRLSGNSFDEYISSDGHLRQDQ